MAMGRAKNRMERLPSVFTAAMLGVLAAQPLGRVVQKYFTTSPDLANTQIVGVRESGKGLVHKVQTVRE
jgi:hypothetical protein